MSEAPVVDYAVEGTVAVLTIDSPPVNALSARVRGGVLDGVRRAAADDAVEAVLLICAGRTFVAGADITEFGKPPLPPSLAEVMAGIEDSPKPVVAAIHGTALGGGLELAMACHFRVAAPSARLGLPEVKLGLIPGAGGTQRLPRLVGVEAALKMITTGEPETAPRAQALGLVDALVPEGELKAGALAFARTANDAPARRARDRAVEATGPEPFEAARKTLARTRRGFLAPQAAVTAVQAALDRPFDEGLAEERRLFVELVEGPQSAAQRYLFFAEREAARIPDIPADTPTRPVARVGVVGGGTMGTGIAQCFANAGLPVVLVETGQDALDRGLATVAKAYGKLAESGKLAPEVAARRTGLVAGALTFEALADCDLIVEAVFEDMAVKKAVFTDLDRVAKPDAVLATNTSYLDVDEIAAATGRPGSVVGLHFFSPAQIMKLLEVVRGARTDKAVVATAMKLARTVGKVAICVGVSPGFVANRMQRERQRQANRLVLEGAAPADVDRVIHDFGMPMGPFAMLDMAGLDIGWREGKPTETVRDLMCEIGRKGIKAGAGFYDYGEDRKPVPSPVAAEAIAGFAARSGVTPRTVSDEEILERCLYAMINEGAKILDEGIALRASDIDLAWVHGYGWPAYLGGPMHHADTLGLAHVLARLRHYADAAGPEFAPSPLIEKLVAEGRGFRDLGARPPG
jgi:3-hydroxyacyl-CoA dehydrogenase